MTQVCNEPTLHGHVVIKEFSVGDTLERDARVLFGRGSEISIINRRGIKGWCAFSVHLFPLLDIRTCCQQQLADICVPHFRGDVNRRL